MTPSTATTIVIEPTQRQRRAPKPKNGRFHVALLAGGPADIAREVRGRLAERAGILAKYHWDYEKSRSFLRQVPSDVDLVIILRDFMGHSNNGRVREACRTSGTLCVTTSSKWTTMYMALYTNGFCGSGAPRTFLPVEVTSTAILQPVGETEPAVEPLPTQARPEPEPEPAPVDAEAVAVPAPEPVIATPETLPKPIMRVSENEMMISVLCAELQRRLRESNCSVTGVMVTAANISIDYAKVENA